VDLEPVLEKRTFFFEFKYSIGTLGLYSSGTLGLYSRGTLGLYSSCSLWNIDGTMETAN
jgi:hypothetical protein